MARIRTLKPEIWMSPQVMNLSHSARLLFIGLITQADDEGRGTADTRRLKASIFGGDDVTSASVHGWLTECSAQRLAIFYHVEGYGDLYQIPTFNAHQYISRPTKSRYPPPPDPESLTERSVETPEGSEGSEGSEGISGTDRRGSSTAAAPPTADSDDGGFAQFRSLYPPRNGDQRWRRAQEAINARLREGATWDEILDGTRRYAAWCEMTGKTGTEHVKQAATFVGPEKPFLEPWEPPPTKAESRTRGNLQAAAQAKRELFGAG